MDNAEKSVFRRKRPLIAKLLKFSIAMQKKYRDYGLLSDAMVADILPEQSDNGQMMKYLDSVMRSDHLDHPFVSVQQLLRQEGEGWVADEMAIDLLAERGELAIEDYVEKESKMIVHKHFGTSKRISEKDKADIADILAVRYQAAKDSIQSQLDRVMKDRDEALRFKQEENAKLKALCEKIQSFLKIQKLRMNAHVDRSSTRGDPDPDNMNLEYLERVDGNVDDLLEVLARVLLEKETLMNERKKCLKVLGLQNVKSTLALEVAIENALRNAADDIEKARREVIVSQQVAHELDEQLKYLKLECDSKLVEKDRHISYLESQVKVHKEKWQNLEAELRRLRAQLAEANETIAKINKRADTLVKTRRLGYYQPGWVEKSYEDHGIDPDDVDKGQALLPLIDNNESLKQEVKPKESKGTPTEIRRRNKLNGSSNAAPGRSISKSRSAGDLHKSGTGPRPLRPVTRKK